MYTSLIKYNIGSLFFVCVCEESLIDSYSPFFLLKDGA